MLERMKDVLRNRKDGDKGFSLVELAVVIVIIGILVAIAVPIFANMQTSAERANIEAAAANGSAMQAAHFAAGETGSADFVGLNKDGVAVTLQEATTATIGDYCVQAVGDKGTAWKGASIEATCNTTSWATPATP